MTSDVPSFSLFHPRGNNLYVSLFPGKQIHPFSDYFNSMGRGKSVFFSGLKNTVAYSSFSLMAYFLYARLMAVVITSTFEVRSDVE